MDAIVSGLMSIMNWQVMLLILGGVALGIVFGAIPGLTANMAVALCIPITFGMDMIPSTSLLVGLYIGGISGGLISAILLKIPGTPSSIATTFDGAPMAARGEAGKALSTGILASFLGGMFSFVVLIFVSPYLAEFAMGFSPFDYFSVVLFSLTLMASLSGPNLKKGLIAGFLGIVVSFVGADPIDGLPRFTFGIQALDGGFAQLPVLIGLFAVAEIIETAEKAYVLKHQEKVSYKVEKIRIPWAEYKDQVWNFFRSCLIGTGIGILPGIGGGVSNLISYTTAKKQSRHPEKFGTGCVDGIIASETANNACIGGAMIPLLTMGIPGDAVTAMLVGGFMIQGVSPGPLMFVQQKELIYAIFGALIVANVCMLLMMFLAMNGFIRVLNTPKEVLLPFVMAICIIGAYGSNNRVFDIFVVLIFGVVGFVLKKFGFPTPPMIMGLILGPIFETNLRRGLMFSHNSIVPFFTQPISLIFICLAVVSVVLTVRKKKKQEESEDV
ncbi:MAG: tripartite tricarboxylate transporter permease [Eubacteriales bacterium]|jgi:putative tricarboxylic transport membrane protein